jgi:hypothetical protein
MFYWISRFFDHVSNILYPNDITDEFWDKDENDAE